jgi:hypothetical protein
MPVPGKPGPRCRKTAGAREESPPGELQLEGAPSRPPPQEPVGQSLKEERGTEASSSRWEGLGISQNPPPQVREAQETDEVIAELEEALEHTT